MGPNVCPASVDILDTGVSDDKHVQKYLDKTIKDVTEINKTSNQYESLHTKYQVEKRNALDL
jgi:hypothetical protein